MGDISDYVNDCGELLAMEEAELYISGKLNEDGEYAQQIHPDLDWFDFKLEELENTVKIAGLEIEYLPKNNELNNKWIQNKIKTCQIMMGIASFYEKNKSLSEKQISIVETNWIGGNSKFKKDIDNNPGKIQELYKKIINKLLAIKG